MEKLEYERLVAKLYDAIISVGIIVGASIAFGGWGFGITFLICVISEYKSKNYILSDGTKH